MIAEAAVRGQTDLGLVRVDSATARARHHAAGMALPSEQSAVLEAAGGLRKMGGAKGRQPQDGQARDEARLQRRRMRRGRRSA